VNRIDFIPDVIWAPGPDGWRIPVSRHDDPERWHALVDTDDAIITQVEDGNLIDGKGISPSSSSSALHVMAYMMDLLDVRPGMHVLEIGTGTGYNAALLAQRTFPATVVTIEVDSGIADHARTALTRTGLPVLVIEADGTLGHLDNAPYDRVISTASATHVPYAWVQQTRPGGKIVLPLVGTLNRQAFTSLTVDPHGHAHGRFHGYASFMRLRNQRDPTPLWRVLSPQHAARVDTNPGAISVTTITAPPAEPLTDPHAGFAAGLLLRGLHARRRPHDGAILLSHDETGSWVSVLPYDGGHRAYHQGPRRLWEDLQAAHQWWIDAGRPEPHRFGITVTPTGQTFWLDSPNNPVPAFGEPATRLSSGHIA